MKLEREFKEVFDFYAKGEDKNNKKINFDELTNIVQKMNLDMEDEQLKKILSQINDSNTE